MTGTYLRFNHKGDWIVGTLIGGPMEDGWVLVQHATHKSYGGYYMKDITDLEYLDEMTFNILIS
jgi:hypothetical protein